MNCPLGQFPGLSGGPGSSGGGLSGAAQASKRTVRRAGRDLRMFMVISKSEGSCGTARDEEALTRQGTVVLTEGTRLIGHVVRAGEDLALIRGRPAGAERGHGAVA